MDISLETLPPIIKDYASKFNKEFKNIIWWCGAGISKPSGLLPKGSVPF